jgi:homoaconitate hydratase
MSQTVIEKITQAHAVGLPAGQELHTGDYVTLIPDHVMTHDNSSAVMEKFKELGAAKIHDPGQPIFTLDHNIQDRGEVNLAKYRAIEQFARSMGVTFYPAGRGIGHQVMVEEGHVRPGGFVVASDSHSNMYGALGAVGTPVVRTDAAVLWATGTVWWQLPRTVKVTLLGELRGDATGKDVILTLCGLYDQGEVLNAAVEFGGPGVANLSLEERLAISNMTTEWGALVGWFPVDAITCNWLEAREVYLRQKRGITDRLRAEEIDRWRQDPPRSEPGAVYAGEITLDLGQISPHISGPDTVQETTPLAELATQKVQIHKAYLVSCVNSRLEDLTAAAAVIQGRRVADGVRFYVAAASQLVEENARASGAWQALLDAGAEPLPPGCGPCIGLGVGLLEPGEVGISATNRNFKGRMGSRDAKCYLANPAVVAASAVTGYISGPETLVTGDAEALAASSTEPISAPRPRRTYKEYVAEDSDTSAVAISILPGFPERVEGRALWLPADNLNSDGIYGKDYTYRDDMTPEQMASVVMENYDPGFAAQLQPDDIIVTGYNFGTGSSREQAVTALQAARIAMITAASFSQTYLRNAFNNGFICVSCPTLAAAMREAYAAKEKADMKSIVSAEPLTVDFKAAQVLWRGRRFACTPLGTQVQELVAAGGVLNQVRRKLQETG